MQRKIEMLIVFGIVILGIGIICEVIRIERDIYNKYYSPFQEGN